MASIQVGQVRVLTVAPVPPPADRAVFVSQAQLSTATPAPTSRSVNISQAQLVLGRTRRQVFVSLAKLGISASSLRPVYVFLDGRWKAYNVYARRLGSWWPISVPGSLPTQPTPVPDTTAPTAPTAVGASATSTSVLLSWAASSDAVGVTGYRVVRNGVLLGSPTGTTFAVSGLTPSTTYTFVVRALDEAGNVSADATVTVTTAAAADTTPPSRPTALAGARTSGSTASLSWTASTDDRAVVGYGVYRTVQGGVPALIATVSGTTFSDNGLGAGNGYYYEVDAVDAAGNRSTRSAGVPVNVLASGDTTAPTAPSNLTVGAITPTSVALSWGASSDAVGVTGYELLVAGTVVDTVSATSRVVSGLSPSTTYTLGVRARDGAGNRSPAATVQVRTAAAADTTAPTVALSRPLAGASLSGVVTVSGTASDNVAVESVTVYAGSTALGDATLSGSTWSFSWNTAGTVNGPVTLTAVALDAAGNETGSAAVLVSVSNVVSPPAPAPTGLARWWIPVGGTPHTRTTHETTVLPNGKAQVAWVSSMPDARAGTTLLEVDVPVLAQTAWEAYVEDLTLTPGNRVVESGIGSGTAQSWSPTGFTPVPGRKYKGWARTQSSDGKWSPWHGSRFVAPTGVTLYFEDFGAVGDGVAVDGSDYLASPSVVFGPIRNAMRAAAPGDRVASKKPGTVLTVATIGASLTSSSAVFTSSMVGKKVMVYDGGYHDTQGTSVHRSTIATVATDGKSAVMATPAPRSQASARVVIGYPTYMVNHLDVDAGMGGANAGRGGFIFDGSGCEFINARETSAGFRTTLPDVTYVDVHYFSKAAKTRGNGKNGDSGAWFTEGANAVGGRYVRCWAERGRDAGFLFYSGPSDQHVVDCVADHTNADGFHVTATAHDIFFIRKTSIYCGDDDGNIGYRSNGDADRPYNIYWESPRTFGQDWGRSLAYGGTHHALASDVFIDGGAMANFLVGSDGDQANTSDVQIRRFTIVNSRVRVGQRAAYSQGSPGGLIQDGMWIKLLVNKSTNTLRQARILIEKGHVTDGAYMQIVCYNGGEFDDATLVLRDITMDGVVNTGWVDQGTYPGHVDLRGITPVGRAPVTAAPSAPNGTPPGSNTTGAWS